MIYSRKTVLAYLLLILPINSNTRALVEGIYASAERIKNPKFCHSLKKLEIITFWGTGLLGRGDVGGWRWM